MAQTNSVMHKKKTCYDTPYTSWTYIATAKYDPNFNINSKS